VVEKDKKQLDWKGAFDIFSRVSAWVVVPIILALVTGRALDRHFGTEPLIFLILAGVSFLVSSYGIVRVVGVYIKKIEQEEKDNKNL
jgi:F0F1-type ATP synthase assembly protein I